VEFQITLCLPREAATAHLTRQVLDASLEILGVTADTRADITLSLSEACANVIQHADDSDEYEVRARVSGDRCVIEVIDTGRGFDAATLGEAMGAPEGEHGRGLQIIRALTENLQIEDRPQHGAMIRFEKSLDWVPGSQAQTLATAAGNPAP
jgi:serine/threonine-protein kinase RsbW